MEKTLKELIEHRDQLKRWLGRIINDDVTYAIIFNEIKAIDAIIEIAQEESDAIQKRLALLTKIED